MNQEKGTTEEGNPAVVQALTSTPAIVREPRLDRSDGQEVGSYGGASGVPDPYRDSPRGKGLAEEEDSPERRGFALTFSDDSGDRSESPESPGRDPTYSPGHSGMAGELRAMAAEVSRLKEESDRDRARSNARYEEMEAVNTALVAALERGQQRSGAMAEAQAAIPPVPPQHTDGGQSSGGRSGDPVQQKPPLGAGPPKSATTSRQPDASSVDGAETPTARALQVLADTVSSLKAQMEANERRAARPMEGARFNERMGPFSHRVIESGRSGNQKSLKLTYSGSGCPYQHLDSFRSQTCAKGYSDAVCCNIFQETLSGEALSWFYELPANSIEAFEQLADRFVSRFILRVEGARTSTILFNCRQAPGEELRTFVNRWQTATAGVRNLDKGIAEMAFKQGLRAGKFSYAVRVELPQGYDELMAMAIRHAQADHETYGHHLQKRKRDEQQEDHPREENPPPAQEAKPNQRTDNRTARPSRNANNRNWPQRQQRSYSDKPQNEHKPAPFRQERPLAIMPAPPVNQEVFTALTTSYEDILLENGSVIPPPPPRRFPKGKLTTAQTGKYCSYHDEATHRTSKCHALRQAVQVLIDNGQLQRYVGKGGTDPDRENDQSW